MTAQTKVALKGYFNTGDRPTESQFTDLIDTIGTLSLTVAASDASDASKGRADYVCDGTADDVQIQAAIDALSVIGGRIILSAGTFNTAATITNDEDLVTLQGMGRWATTIRPGIGQDPDPIVLFGDTGIVNRCSIYDLLIHGREDSDPGHSGDGLHFNVNGGILRGVDVNWTGGDGIVVDGVSAQQIFEVVVDSCKIYFPGNDGLVVGPLCLDSVFDKVWVQGGSQQGTPFGRYGIMCAGESNIFKDCHAYHNQSYGFGTQGGLSAALFIEGGAYETNDTGAILILNALRGHIKGIWCYGNGGNQDLLLQTCDNFVVANNVFTSAVGKSINLLGTTNGIIINNVCDAGTVRGIDINTSADGNIITGNRVEPDGGASQAILIDASDNNKITDNILTDSITISGGSSGNDIRGNDGYVTENEGAAPNIADGGTIAHGLVTTPIVAVCTPSVAGEMVSVTGLDGTNITVAIKQDDGSAGTSQTIYWRAWV